MSDAHGGKYVATSERDTVTEHLQELAGDIVNGEGSPLYASVLTGVYPASRESARCSSAVYVSDVVEDDEVEDVLEALAVTLRSTADELDAEIARRKLRSSAVARAGS